MPAQDASQSTQEDQKSKKESPEKKTEEPPSRVFSRAIVPPKEWNPSKEHSVASPPEHLTGAATPATDNPSIPMGPHAAFVMEMYGPREEEISRRAWRYLLATREPATGFYDSVIHYPATTMWDMGSSMAALVSAERLKLLSTTSFQLHMRQLLKSLASMPLYHDELPNREYSTRALVMLDHHSAPSGDGSGWSAVDLGRLLIWLRIVATWYPDMKATCEAIVARWSFDRLRTNEEANGVSLEEGKEYLRQEGRLGYEQYAAKGFSFWGIYLPKAWQYDHTKPVSVMGTVLRQDDRGHSFLTSEPFFLVQMEIGSIDPFFESLSSAILEVQRRRWEKTGILTAISEDSTSLEPWFVYNTVLFDDTPWDCVSPGGKPYPALKSLSTKAAVAYAALGDGPFAEALESATDSLADPRYGYYAGKYEKGGINRSLNINTNAVVLEAMLFRKLGRRAFLQVVLEPDALSSEKAGLHK